MFVEVSRDVHGVRLYVQSTTHAESMATWSKRGEVARECEEMEGGNVGWRGTGTLFTPGSRLSACKTVPIRWPWIDSQSHCGFLSFYWFYVSLRFTNMRPPCTNVSRAARGLARLFVELRHRTTSICTTFTPNYVGHSGQGLHPVGS